MPECAITGRLNGERARVEDYQEYFDPCNRPHKFASVEVGFTIPAPGSINYRCGDCRHYFVNGPRDRRVCEIMRLPGEAAVPMLGACRFWNREGKYPLLNIL